MNGDVTAPGLVVKRVTALAHSAVAPRLVAMLDADEPVYFDAVTPVACLSRQPGRPSPNVSNPLRPRGQRRQPPVGKQFQQLPIRITNHCRPFGHCPVDHDSPELCHFLQHAVEIRH